MKLHCVINYFPNRKIKKEERKEEKTKTNSRISLTAVFMPKVEFSKKLIASWRPLSGGKIKEEMSDVKHHTLLLPSIAIMREKFRKQHCFPSVSNLHKLGRKMAYFMSLSICAMKKKNRACVWNTEYSFWITEMSNCSSPILILLYSVI